ncbi:hypothetical protein ACFX1R_029032 [Malus domestica]
MNGIDPSYTTWVFHDDGTGKANLLIGDENFKQKVEEVEAPLYEDKLFDELLQALKDIFPKDFEQLETCPKCGSSR